VNSRMILAGSLIFVVSMPVWLLAQISTSSFTEGLVTNVFNPFSWLSINLEIFASAAIYHGLTHINTKEAQLKGFSSSRSNTKLRRIGLTILAVGAALTYFGRASFACDPVNPLTQLESCHTYYFQPIWPPYIFNSSQQAAQGTFGVGAVVLILGAVLTAASFTRPSNISDSTIEMEKAVSRRTKGWLILGPGVLISAISTLAADQTTCTSLPSGGPSYCGIQFLFGMVFGLTLTFLGLALILSSPKEDSITGEIKQLS